jgi:hypothetical protein
MDDGFVHLHENHFGLHVEQEVKDREKRACNVGTDTAYNATLYVEAFQGAVLTLNTTISLGTINGGNYTSVDSQVVYPGYV